LPQASLKLVSRSAQETQRLGEIIGELCRAGDVILLSGVLGTGKTCLTQGIARGLGIAESITSPTFVLMREFAGRLPLYHVDLYRLEFKEIGDLGLDEYLYGHGVCVIEWAEKGMALLPAEHLLIKLDYLGENGRNIEVVPSSPRYRRMLSDIVSSLRPARGEKA